MATKLSKSIVIDDIEQRFLLECMPMCMPQDGFRYWSRGHEAKNSARRMSGNVTPIIAGQWTQNVAAQSRRCDRGALLITGMGN